MTKVRIAEMTSAEFAERTLNKPAILIPVGATEPQGPHAPMGDYLLAERLGDDIARAADAIVAPTMPYSDSSFFRGIAGCITLRPETVEAVLEDVLASFVRHGFGHLVILNGQTGNGPLIDRVVRRLRDRHDIMVPSVNLWRVLTPEALAEIYGPDLSGSQGHGGDPITSMFLHQSPDLVRMDLAAPPPRFKQAFGLPTKSVSSLLFEGWTVPMPLDITEMSPTGNLSGDASKSSAERGAASHKRLVDTISRFVRHFRSI